MIELFTIGFTQKSAERFFTLLKEHQVSVLVDIRLKPDSQLSGWAKRQDHPIGLDALVFAPFKEPLGGAMLVDQGPPQAEAGRSALAIALLDQPALTREHLG